LFKIRFISLERKKVERDDIRLLKIRKKKNVNSKISRSFLVRKSPNTGML
jgi:hypothetical protein